MSRERRNIARAAGIMSAATFISRVLGYVRDMILAFYLGASGLSDTFFVSFRIPNLLRELFAEGSISSAVIPVLTEYQGRDPKEAARLVRVAMAAVLTIVGALTALGIVFAPAIVALMAPGFLGDPVKFPTAVLLTRIMFPFLFFISLAALLMGALNTRRVFFVPALAPAMLNVTVIATTVGLIIGAGVEPVIAVAVGVALGGFVQFAFQGPKFIAEGYSLRPSFDFRHPGLRRIGTLLLPATLGMAVAQVNIVVSSILASFLPDGSITYLFYSMRLVQFPVGVFGVAMAMAVLPSLSAHASEGREDLLREDFSFALRLLFFISIPAMAGLIALREPIVSVLFERGEFGVEATRGTATALLYYASGVWAFVGVRTVAATFYSLQDTKTPVKVASLSLLANAALSIVLMGPLAHNGLAFANALASMINFTVLIHLLRKRLGRIGGRSIAGSLARTALASVVMGASAAWVAGRVQWHAPGQTLMKAGALAGAVILSALWYIVIAHMLRCEELAFVRSAIMRKLKGRQA
jgi:putative peptidoglycan lipid II flippase